MPDLSLDESSIQIPPDIQPLDGNLSRAARVLLAMDIRARLTAAKPDVRLRMTSSYFDCANSERLKAGSFDSSKIPTKVCEVCARGALFLASVDRYNECVITEDELDSCNPEYRYFVVRELADERSMTDFGQEQGNDIEYAFEQERHNRSAKSTMLAICENLIANHGEFITAQHRGFLAAKRVTKSAAAVNVEASPA